MKAVFVIPPARCERVAEGKIFGSDSFSENTSEVVTETSGTETLKAFLSFSYTSLALYIG